MKSIEGLFQNGLSWTSDEREGADSKPCAEREVKKASRELHSQTSRMNDLQKIDHLTKRCADLLAEMKRLERESIKNKKRGDQLQKDKDNSRNELNKTTSLKEKLEKLCRELQKENNKLKVWNHRCGKVAFRALTNSCT